MLEKLFKKDKKSQKSQREQDIVAFTKISERWNFEDIQKYLRGHIDAHKVSDAGLASILHRFNHRKTADKKQESGERREFEISDNLERTKKGFDIVMSIAANKNLGNLSIELINVFNTTFSDVIKHFDQKLSQTYQGKLKDAYKNAQVRALTKAKISKSLDYSQGNC